MIRIVFLSAIAQEYQPFIRAVGRWRKSPASDRTAYTFRDADRDLLLVESGMGRENIGRAVDEALGCSPADLVVSFGFAGSLSHALDVGQVLLIDRFTVHGGNSAGAVVSGLHLQPSGDLSAFCRSVLVQRARIVTVDGFADKLALAGHYADALSVVDMESAYLAEAVVEKRIPLLCFRGISDALTDSLGFEMSDISDGSGKISVSRVCRSVVRKPWICKSLYESWRRSDKAARKLAFVLRNFVNLPPLQLQKIIEETSLLPGQREIDAMFPKNDYH